jgi:hypothetical protein
MNSSSGKASSKRNHSSPPLNTVFSGVASRDSIADKQKTVIISRSSFHVRGCSWLGFAKPREGKLWQTYMLMVFPCRKCWSTKFINRWQQALRRRHKSCHTVPTHTRPSSEGLPPVDQSLPLPGWVVKQVLNRERRGEDQEAIVTGLANSGFELSGASVGRVLERTSPYDDPIYDHRYWRRNQDSDPPLERRLKFVDLRELK